MENFYSMKEAIKEFAMYDKVFVYLINSVKLVGSITRIISSDEKIIAIEISSDEKDNTSKEKYKTIVMLRNVLAICKAKEGDREKKEKSK